VCTVHAGGCSKRFAQLKRNRKISLCQEYSPVALCSLLLAQRCNGSSNGAVQSRELRKCTFCAPLRRSNNKGTVCQSTRKAHVTNNENGSRWSWTRWRPRAVSHLAAWRRNDITGVLHSAFELLKVSVARQAVLDRHSDRSSKHSEKGDRGMKTERTVLLFD